MGPVPTLIAGAILDRRPREGGDPVVARDAPCANWIPAPRLRGDRLRGYDVAPS